MYRKDSLFKSRTDNVKRRLLENGRTNCRCETTPELNRLRNAIHGWARRYDIEIVTSRTPKGLTIRVVR